MCFSRFCQLEQGVSSQLWGVLVWLICPEVTDGIGLCPNLIMLLGADVGCCWANSHLDRHWSLLSMMESSSCPTGTSLHCSLNVLISVIFCRSHWGFMEHHLWTSLSMSSLCCSPSCSENTLGFFCLRWCGGVKRQEWCHCLTVQMSSLLGLIA